MYINFNSKYFTLAAIALGCYLFVQMQAAKGPQINDFDDATIIPKAKYVLEIDPNKSEHERSVLEKMIYKYALSKDVVNQMQQGEFGNRVFYSDIPISEGDRVTIHLKELGTSVESEAPITIIVGSKILHKSIEEALIGMKQGDKKNVDHIASDGTTKKFEIEVIAVTAKLSVK